MSTAQLAALTGQIDALGTTQLTSRDGAAREPLDEPAGCLSTADLTALDSGSSWR
ncbi:MAG: hypothetical protein U1F25_03190 [Rubrivivax sp.]